LRRGTSEPTPAPQGASPEPPPRRPPHRILPAAPVTGREPKRRHSGVESDDGDRDADAYKLIEGDKVTVNGVIDDDLFEGRELVADSLVILS
jgi:hypothetical protein